MSITRSSGAFRRRHPSRAGGISAAALAILLAGGRAAIVPEDGLRAVGVGAGFPSATLHAQEPHPQPPQEHAPASPGEHGDPQQHTTPRTGDAGDEHGGPPGEHGSEAAHESPWTLVARLTNFAILAGALVYLLRSPVAQYLADRSAQVRKDLVTARDIRANASRQIHEIDRRLEALPGEIEALKVRGAEEIAAEERRIQDAAAAERERLIEQTRREIDMQLRAARRELMEEAANLVVGIASDRVKRSITAADQVRLVDRYLEQVKQPQER